ncbi:hypothetical protein [Melittangium boletus]|uniref:Uncharacterized protein n=1 Tax=Melittangium boletus DSM 14713 TaxID=1294270 RepID=A0A250ID17_9BACT|nr:hypothetical protein [Melittangium boletus]ATB29744.1 hypothetical protein MEBOL_003199 [Melittangium boletus DSM 14713]
MINHTVRSQIIANYEGKRNTQRPYLDKEGNNTALAEYLYQKLTADMVVDLLDDAKQRPVGYSIPGETPELSRKYMAGQLLDAMRGNGWYVTAGIHEGGVGSAKHDPDPNPHFNLRIANGRQLHMVCKLEPRVHIIQIKKP